MMMINNENISGQYETVFANAILMKRWRLGTFTRLKEAKLLSHNMLDISQPDLVTVSQVS